MAVTIKQLREYLRDPPEDDETLQPFLNAARAKARAAGVPDFQHNAMYDLFLLALATMYYENRGMSHQAGGTAQQQAQNMINSFVLELRYAKEDAEEEANGIDE